MGKSLYYIMLYICYITLSSHGLCCALVSQVTVTTPDVHFQSRCVYILMFLVNLIKAYQAETCVCILLHFIVQNTTERNSLKNSRSSYFHSQIHVNVKSLRFPWIRDLQNCYLLGCNAVRSGRTVPTFQKCWAARSALHILATRCLVHLHNRPAPPPPLECQRLPTAFTVYFRTSTNKQGQYLPAGNSHSLNILTSKVSTLYNIIGVSEWVTSCSHGNHCCRVAFFLWHASWGRRHSSASSIYHNTAQPGGSTATGKINTWFALRINKRQADVSDRGGVREYEEHVASSQSISTPTVLQRPSWNRQYVTKGTHSAFRYLWQANCCVRTRQTDTCWLHVHKHCGSLKNMSPDLTTTLLWKVLKRNATYSISSVAWLQLLSRMFLFSVVAPVLMTSLIWRSDAVWNLRAVVLTGVLIWTPCTIRVICTKTTTLPQQLCFCCNRLTQCQSITTSLYVSASERNEYQGSSLGVKAAGA